MSEHVRTGNELRAWLAARASLMADIRAFFAARDVLEVDTPALSPAANPDPAIEPIATGPASLGGRIHYLHTSPELAMKRLLAAGSGDIYQLCRVFRDGELGRWHEPEFVMLEWYRLGFDEHRLMDEVRELLTCTLAPFDHVLGHARLTYASLFDRHFGIDPHAPGEDLATALCTRLAARGVDVPAGLEQRALLDLAFSLVIVPALPRDTIVFVCDYPVEQAALAAIKDTAPPVAARFEVFIDGIELGNGFRELTDPREQRARFAADRDTRRAAGRPAPPLDEPFLAALERGLPPCAGVALGIDRLVAVAFRADCLADAVNLPHTGRAGA